MYLILAHDRNFGIGYKNKIPWTLPEDLGWFKKHTVNKTVIMGTNTAMSLGRPLPNRRNVVVSRHKLGIAEGFEFMSFREALALGTVNSFVIGGKQIYEAFMPYAKRLYATEIDLTYTCDTRFEYSTEDFNLIFNEDNHTPDGTDYTFKIYEKK